MSEWQRLFARPGGTVAGFATVEVEVELGGTLVFAATSAGVFTSTDGGQQWSRSGGGDIVPFNSTICVSPDRAVYVGGRNGVYRSDDLGKTWARMLADARVLSLALAGDLLLVGTEQDGVLRSADGGRTFVGANAGLVDLTVTALAASPDFERDGTAFLASASGLYRTRNAGKSWRALDVDSSVESLCVSPTFPHDGVVLAGTETEGLLRSNDAGAHWEHVSELEARSITALAYSSRCSTIAAATEHGIALSDTSSAAWRMTRGELGPVLALNFVTVDTGEVLLAGLHRHGVARATTPFDRWTRANDGLSARLLLGLTLSPAFDTDQAALAAGPDDGVLVSRDAGRTWSASLTEAEDPQVFSIGVSPDFAEDHSLFTATDAGLLRSRDSGVTWSVAMGDGAASAVVAAPQRIIVAVAHGSLMESDDNGDTWRTLDPRFDGEVVSMTRAPDGTLFVGTSTADQLTLWRCVNDARERWLIERGNGLVPLAVSPTYGADATVYVGAGSRVLSPMHNTREVRAGERRPIWRGVDLGAAITALATAADAKRRRIVFAATSAGVFVSRDGGETFAPWRDGGPAATVAIAASPNYAQDGLVYALELGGTIWRRRDTD